MLGVQILLLWLALQLSSPVTAPATAPAPPGPAGSEWKVSVITLGPGTAPWERFGHNMLRIRREGVGDVAFNWGVFQFDDSFLWNFVQGRLLYWMEPEATQPLLDYYISQDRDIWEQELNLTPAQKQFLVDFCQYNAEPENSRYKYDYFRDNCSTRVRDAIDRALGGALQRETARVPSDRTFRSESYRLTAADPLLYTGMAFILGHPTDAPISQWDEMFIPTRMRARLNGVTITDPQTGQSVPLVSREIRIHASAHPERQAPPFWIPWFLLIGIGFGAAAIGAEELRRRGHRWRARLTAIVPLIWCLVSGIGGFLGVYVWIATDHAAARPNENVLQCTVLMLPLLLLIPLGLGGKRWAAGGWFSLAVIATALSILGFVLQVLPMMSQVNGDIIAVALPANAGIALAGWHRYKTLNVTAERN